MVSLLSFFFLLLNQITTLPTDHPDAYATANKLRLEYVIAVEGTVRPRPAESQNKKMKTGLIEVPVPGRRFYV